MVWLTLTIISIICLTAKALLARIWSQTSQNQRAFALFYNSFASIFALILSSIVFGRFPAPAKTTLFAFGLLLLNAAIYSIYNRSIWMAAKLVEASTLSVIISITGLISLVFSRLLYQEKLTFTKVLGALLIAFATTIIGDKFRSRIEKKGLVAALTAGLVLGTASSLDKLVSQQIGTEFYNMAIWGLTLPFLLLTPPLSKESLRQEWKLINPLQLAIMAALNVGGYFAFLYGLKFGQVFKVISLLNFVTILTVISSIIFLKETKDWRRKIFAGLLATLGAILLV